MKKPSRLVCGWIADEFGQMHKFPVGKAWDNEDGTLAIRLDAVPFTRKLIVGPLRPAAPPPEADPWGV